MTRLRQALHKSVTLHGTLIYGTNGMFLVLMLWPDLYGLTLVAR